ncbi:hypothetical protein [Azospirillum brasilense]|uniref:hypothetical protein n=1 Tax=Azospirillum brasilense TaxID=192 RepID=UPI000FF2FE70|nr:hypothetical protein [Azospirillum brasilense]NUB24328.1 hypothetical protein [Azospirillum brasilense]NUB30845.1 hypothetical protein [Azospirillum brasilense]RIW01008.1 hypothetical protein D2T81_19565 [Azospirillum brasilense]
MAQKAAKAVNNAEEMVEYDGIKFEPMTVEQFDKETSLRTEQYAKALDRSDEELYRSLRHIYRTFLFAQVDTRLKEHVNKQVAGKLDIKEFDIRDQPEKNKFSKLLTAYILTHSEDERKNSKKYHVPQRNNTYAMAMHYALREKWTPAKFFDELNGTGLRQLRDNEIKARGGDDDQTDVEQFGIGEALEALREGDVWSKTSVEVSDDMELMSGLNLLLANVNSDGKSITMLRPVEVSKNEIDQFVKVIAKAHSIDSSHPKQFLRTIQAASVFFDRAAVDNMRVTMKTTESETFVCVALEADRTDKQVRFVVSRAEGVPEGLPENAVLGFPPGRMRALSSLTSGTEAVTDWEFETEDDPNEEGKRLGRKVTTLLASVKVKGSDGAFGNEQRRWSFLADDAPRAKDITEEQEHALNADGHVISLNQWEQALEASYNLAVKIEENPETKSKKFFWTEFSVDEDGVYLSHRSEFKRKGKIDAVDHPHDGKMVSTALADNIPDKLSRFIDDVRLNAITVSAHGKYVAIRGQSRGIRYAVGLERRALTQKVKSSKKAGAAKTNAT